MDPYSQHCSFQNLLNSQQLNTQHPEPSIQLSASDASVYSSQWTEYGNDDAETVSARKERRKWSPTEDGVLISGWLNTSKDPIVATDQKANAFWKRIAAYVAASPKLDGLQKRGPTCCKQRWGKINEGVCKFVGSYAAATKQRASGQNDNDVLKMAHEIFYNDYKVKFTMEHAWLELRHDQKWCGASSDKLQSKKRKVDDQTAHEAANFIGEEQARPVGVKASKAKGKRSVGKQASLEDETKEFESLFVLKDKLNKQKLLDGLITKPEPLTELEIALKNKLITDMLSS